MRPSASHCKIYQTYAIRLTIAVLLTVAFLASFSIAFAQDERPISAQQVGLADISDHLEIVLASATGPVSFLVVLDDQYDATALIDAANGAELSREEKAAQLYHTLTQHAYQSQAPLRAWLEERSVSYRPFYIVNMIEVTGDTELAMQLRTLQGVDRLISNPQVIGQQQIDAQPAAPWLQPIPVRGNISESAWASGLYGLTNSNAPEVWAMGYTGQGIVVASQDTGVKWDHPAIKQQYRGWDANTNTVSHVYNWLDAYGLDGETESYDSCGPDYQTPCDDYGHGTHTVGTILGDATDDPSDEYYNPKSIIGMAPDAEWIACRNMYYGRGSPVSYTDCFQFMLAPYPQDGDPFTDGRPELAPNIINNSWSCPESEGCESETLRQVVETTRAAGIMIVASASNDGPSCNTIQNPIGIYDATFTVGAHDYAGNAASFSSRGFVTSDGSFRLKPDIMAPGQSVLSATSYNGYDSYDFRSGTSMASPHVAGAAALIWSAAPELIGQIELTEQVLIKSATPVYDSSCLDSGEAVSPNPTYGYGRLDVLAAVKMALSPWQFSVTVRDVNGQVQPNAVVVLEDERTGYQFVRTTNNEGVAQISMVYEGEYQLSASSDAVTVVQRDIPLEATGVDTTDKNYHTDLVLQGPTGLENNMQPAMKLYLPSVANSQ